MLDEGFAIDFDYWFSRETGGIESGGDDRDYGIDLHQNTAVDLSMAVSDSAGLLWQRTCTAQSVGSLERSKKVGPIELLY